jgi:hypothetical protein
LLPELAAEVLAKIAASERFNQITLGVDERAGFRVSLNQVGEPA